MYSLTSTPGAKNVMKRKRKATAAPAPALLLVPEYSMSRAV